MHRFFIPPELVSKIHTSIALPKETAHQVRDVLRLQVSEQLILLDNSGDEVLASVATMNKSSVEVYLQERRPGKSESLVRIILCQGLLKSARFEWILEKGTELGVSTFSPILCRRSMAGLEDAGVAKIARWKRIVQEAAEQCGRSRIPDLLPIRPLMHALNDIPSGAIALMPWEEEHQMSLKSALLASSSLPQTDASPSPITVVLFIGPEGGLMAEEVKLAQRFGVQPVSLGPRILRAETAALTAVANVMYELERW
ncbi:MAG TPA: 16S rRNA (uracil(1498)-N(3))-methyltransferase [Ktedonobacteraceae bacterium]|jgi:16S rRNA (uracil1498-N3)-methyltransferase|nr:16S rRNA (uracil(1498)-N(3))-methyltransferase [Ktedonobacteraceae bacterium]